MGIFHMGWIDEYYMNIFDGYDQSHEYSHE
jgi:hypothetical protein